MQTGISPCSHRARRVNKDSTGLRPSSSSPSSPSSSQQTGKIHRVRFFFADADACTWCSEGCCGRDGSRSPPSAASRDCERSSIQPLRFAGPDSSRHVFLSTRQTGPHYPLSASGLEIRCVDPGRRPCPAHLELSAASLLRYDVEPSLPGIPAQASLQSSPEPTLDVPAGGFVCNCPPSCLCDCPRASPNRHA